MPSDVNPAIPSVEAQQDSVSEGSTVGNGNIDRDEKNRTVGPNVIDLNSSEFVDRSMQLKVDELSHPESTTDNSASLSVEEKASNPDLAELKIDELSSPIESTSVPVDPPTPEEKTSESRPTASASPSPLPSPRRLSNMPALVDLSDLILHSPSSHIIGTPFATNTTRFEYPFPETSSSSNPASGSSSPPSSSSAFTFGSASGSSFPVISTSQSASQISPLSLPYPLSSSETPSYNPTHPKLKTQLNPPVPPSLQKKRTRWSMNLLGRRKSSFGSDDSVGTTSTIDSLLAGSPPQVASPSMSPREERGKH